MFLDPTHIVAGHATLLPHTDTGHATSPNSAFLLPLLQVVSILGQPRRAYYKLRARTTIAGGALLSRDHLCETVFLLLYGDQR